MFTHELKQLPVVMKERNFGAVPTFQNTQILPLWLEVFKERFDWDSQDLWIKGLGFGFVGFVDYGIMGLLEYWIIGFGIWTICCDNPQPLNSIIGLLSFCRQIV